MPTNLIIAKIIEMFVSKKRLIGWGAAVALAVGAAASGMQTEEFKSIVCAAPVINPEAK